MAATMKLVSFLVLTMIVDQVAANCDAAGERLKKSLSPMADQMDARCKVVKKIPSNKLMPMLEKGESVVNNPGELKGKLPAEMGKIYKSLKGVVGKSGGLDYCNKGNRDELMQKMQSSVMPYLFPVKGAYDKHCEDYAKFVEGPSGAALMKEMSALIEKSMA